MGMKSSYPYNMLIRHFFPCDLLWLFHSPGSFKVLKTVFGQTGVTAFLYFIKWENEQTQKK